jgi:hypothetical protein
VPSLRNTVIGLVTSTGIVLVLAGANAGVFTAWPFAPTTAQPVPADHPVTSQPAPVIPPVALPPPAAADPPLAEPAPAPADPPATQSNLAPMVGHAEYRAPIRRQPVPVAHPPVPVAPAPSFPPVSGPPGRALPSHDFHNSGEDQPSRPSRGYQSRTVNTEPCYCDGQMRRVHTHWDPPET